MKDSLKGGIYSIRLDGINVYIGRTICFRTRYKQHMREIELGETFKYKVLKRAVAAGMRLEFEIIREVEDRREQCSLEEYYMKMIPCLLNRSGIWNYDGIWKNVDCDWSRTINKIARQADIEDYIAVDKAEMEATVVIDDNVPTHIKEMVVAEMMAEHLCYKMTNEEIREERKRRIEEKIRCTLI